MRPTATDVVRSVWSELTVTTRCGLLLQMSHVACGLNYALAADTVTARCGLLLQMSHVACGLNYALAADTVTARCGLLLQMFHVVWSELRLRCRHSHH